jgi:hypothetical protein
MNFVEPAIDYIATAKGGDLAGMSLNPATYPIETPRQLAVWRNLVRIDKALHVAADNLIFAADTAPAYHKSRKRKAFRELLERQYFAHAALADIYGADTWSKYHARTTWAVRKV